MIAAWRSPIRGSGGADRTPMSESIPYAVAEPQVGGDRMKPVLASDKGIRADVAASALNERWEQGTCHYEHIAFLA